MYTLIIDCSGFALEHGVHIIDAAGNTVGLMHLPTSEIAGFVAREKNVSNVKLSGPVEFCNGIKEEIENEAALEYANNKRKLTVEVI